MSRRPRGWAGGECRAQPHSGSKLASGARGNGGKGRSKTWTQFIATALALSDMGRRWDIGGCHSGALAGPSIFAASPRAWGKPVQYDCPLRSAGYEHSGARVCWERPGLCRLVRPWSLSQRGSRCDMDENRARVFTRSVHSERSPRERMVRSMPEPSVAGSSVRVIKGRAGRPSITGSSVWKSKPFLP